MCIYRYVLVNHFAPLVYKYLVVTMANNEFKHLVLVKFKEDVVVEDILKELEKLAHGTDLIKSFVW